MFQNLFPSEDCGSAYDIDFLSYYEKGYRGILFDVDNTLVEHGQPATARAVGLFEYLKKMGFKTCIISNNREERVTPFADALGAQYVYKAGKPSARGYIEGMRRMDTPKEATLFVGDQIFTDVLGANRAGVHSILVKPISKREEIQIVLKRKLEYFVLKKYAKMKARANPAPRP